MNDPTALIDLLSEAVDILAGLPPETAPNLRAEQAALAGISRIIERLLEAAGEAELMALHDLSALFYEQIQQILSSQLTLTAEQRMGLEEWPTHVMLYLDMPQDSESLRTLINHLQQPYWPQPLSDEDALALSELFGAASDSVPPEAAAPWEEAPTATLEQLPTTPASSPVAEEATEVALESDSRGFNPPPDEVPSLTLIGDLYNSETLIAPEVELLPIPPTDAEPSLDNATATAPNLEDADALAESTAAPEPTVAIAVEVEAEAEVAEITELTSDYTEHTTEAVTSNLRTEPLSVAEQEIIDLLSTELSLLNETLDSLDQATTRNDPAALTLALDNTGELLERIASALEAVGLNGLAQATLWVRSPLQASLTPEQLTLVNLWPQQAMLYLQALPHTAEASADLLTYFQDPAWSTVVTADHLVELQQSLARDRLQTEEPGETPERMRHAQAEDVSLAPPADINPELLDSLLQELPEQSGEFSRLVELITGGAGLISDLDNARRIAHTLKGAANTVGIRGIALLTHQLEDILEVLVKAQVMPNALLADTLLRAADCLAAMSDAVQGNTAPPEDAQAILQEVLDWANLIDRDGLTQTSAAPPLRSIAPPLPAQVGADALPTEPSAASGDSGNTLRVAETLINELMRLVGENLILNSQLQDRLSQSGQRLRNLREQSQRFLQLGNELEQLVDIRGLGSHTRASATRGEFDPLELEQYHELHTLSRRLVETSNDAHVLQQDFQSDLRGINQLLEQQTHLQRDLEEQTLSARMLPASLLTPRLQRGVRQAARAVDKPIDLRISGAHTLIDNQVLQTLAEPLMHLLRNAIDHGIEPAAQRVAFGKAETGQIDIHFGREGQNIIVRCQDDGQGLNYSAIRARAEERGLISAKQAATDEQLAQLILQPGFSTRAGVTQISGRGVGMDVVNTWVQALKGSLRIQSQPGRGTSFDLRLPVSLMSTHGLLTACAGQHYVIAQRGIMQLLPLDPNALKRLGKQQVYRHDNLYYTTTNLYTLLGLAEATVQTVLLVESDTGPQAVIAPALLSGREWVIKKLSALIPPLPGLLGATIMGDGSIAAVLDLPDLLRGASHSYAGQRPVGSAAATPTPAVRALRALVVDDSLSARRALMQTLQDAGFSVEGARDGMEATQMLAKQRPDILLVDLEMPRMNGLELAHHVRHNPALQTLPIIMVTSRSTQKHRDEAASAGVNSYLTKPFQDREVLAQVQALLAQTQALAG